MPERGQISGKIRYPDVTPPTVDVLPPTFLPDRFASEELRTTWLGHASHYIEYPSGLRVLLDPVLEERCSPFSFMGPKRFTKQPCAIADLPFLDAVIISHNHYDHLSHPTVLEIHRRFPNAHFFVPMGVKKWFNSCGIQNVTELDWWEDAELTVNIADASGGKRDSGLDTDTKAIDSITAKITCLPAQHLSSRTGWDFCKTLWASWAIKSGSGPADERSVWFGGDTGYRSVPEMPDDEDDYSDRWAHLPRNPQFKQIGELRGPFDLGLIPIGAYAPRWAFSRMHANPFDAVEMFADTRCKQALGIHWGTWTLTTEPVLEPPAKLRDALRRKGVAEEGVFDVCDIGASRHF